jgi:glycosyltransferase involved in cell wall biosynthesis
VLFVTNWYPSKAEPIKALWAREQAKAAALYDEVAVLHCLGARFGLKRLFEIENDPDENLYAGVTTWQLRHAAPPVPQLDYFVYFSSVVWGCRELVRRGFRPDLIHIQVYDAAAPAVLFAKLMGIPVVVSEHFSSFPRKKLGPLDLVKARIAFRGASVVVTPSHFLRKAIEAYHFRPRFEVVANVADPGFFYPAECRRSGSKIIRLLTVIQLNPIKGVPYLLRAISMLWCKRKDFRLDIIGDGPSRTSLEQLACDLKLEDLVTFHGPKELAEVAKFMRMTDLFILPSLVETFSVPVAEALSSGVPVLSTRCGGPEELIVEDTGKLVTPGDANALFEGLDYMLNNLDRYSHGFITAYARERFSAQSVGIRLHQLYQSLVTDAG